MSQNDSKVIGFFAFASRNEVVCTEGAACVIAGSKESMVEYLKEIDPANIKKHTIKKTRFGEIMQGLQYGAAYAFDEESYICFYPLAREEGLDVQQADFQKQKLVGGRFFTVQIVEI